MEILLKDAGKIGEVFVATGGGGITDLGAVLNQIFCLRTANEIDHFNDGFSGQYFELSGEMVFTDTYVGGNVIECDGAAHIFPYIKECFFDMCIGIGVGVPGRIDHILAAEYL